MKDKHLYLFDSSIWIAIERGDQAVIKKAQPILESNKVCLCDLIIVELLRGARTENDYQGVKLRLDSFPCYTASWSSVARLSFELIKAGYLPPLTDIYIALCAFENKKTLVTQDKHFKNIHAIKKFKLDYW